MPTGGGAPVAAAPVEDAAPVEVRTRFNAILPFVYLPYSNVGLCATLVIHRRNRKKRQYSM